MPWIVESVSSVGFKKRKRQDNIIILKSGPVFGNRKRILLHKESQRALAALPDKSGKKNSCIIRLDDVRIHPGHSLFTLSEQWIPGVKNYDVNTTQYFLENGWIWYDESVSSIDGSRIDSIYVSKKKYGGMEHYIHKYSETSTGADFTEWTNKVKLPAFICDLYLLHYSDTFYKKGNRIYKKNFDYRNTVSPFARNILRQVEEAGFMQIKDLQGIKNSDAVVESLVRLQMLNNLEGLYLVLPSLLIDVPKKVREIRKKNPEISLTELADITAVPKKILLLIMREYDEN